MDRRINIPSGNITRDRSRLFSIANIKVIFEKIKDKDDEQNKTHIRGNKGNS